MHQWVGLQQFLIYATVFAFVDFASANLTSKPIVIIHGILDNAADLNDLKTSILKTRPGTAVHVIDMYDNMYSFDPLWKQVEGIRPVIDPIMKAATDGVILIGFSQDTSYIDEYLPFTMKSELYEFFYSWEGQRWSLGNYWRDPHQLKLYRKYSNYLAQLNNESEPDANSIFRDSWKANFMKLKKLILIGGPDDGVITPWQSAFFGCFDDTEAMVPMRELDIYRKDSFGLRSLDKANAIVECVVPGVEHVKWHGNGRAFRKCIAPFLY